MRILALIVLVACGGEASIPADTARSGTRLKLSWFEFDDGSRSWDSEIFDSVIGEPCVARRWEDGELRCTPSFSPGIAFRDDACTMPMLVGDATHGIELRTDDCGETVPVKMAMPTDEPVTTPTAFEHAEDGRCVPIFNNNRPVSGRVARVLAKPDLVAVTRVFQGDGRIVIETLSGSDGLLLPIRPYDSEIGAACMNFDKLNFNTNGMANITDVPCVLEATQTDIFSDVTCQTPAVLGSSDNSCPHARIASIGEDGPCHQYFTVGNTRSQFAFASSFGSCFERQNPMGAVYPVTKAVFPVTLARTPGATAARLQPIYVGADSSRIREQDLFFDTESDMECQLTQQNLESFVCEPITRGSLVEKLFTDPACQQSVDVSWIRDEDGVWGCIPFKPYDYAVAGDMRREILGRHEGQLYKVELTACMPYSIGNASPFDLGAPVTIPRARATKRRDP